MLSLALTTATQAQAPRPKERPGVHQMEIYEGGRLTVRYFPIGVSPGEEASVRDLERAVNDAAYAAELQSLKRRYVADEKQLEPLRMRAQEWLYGASATSPLIGTGFGTLGYAWPRGLRSGIGLGYYGGGGLVGVGGGFPFGYGGYSALGGGLAGRAVASGALDPGPVKDEVARVIARESTTEYAVAAERNLDRAVASVGGSPILRAEFKLPESKDGSAFIKPLATEPTGPVVVTLKNGRQYAGSKLDRNVPGWLTLHGKSTKLTFPLSEVTLIEESTGVAGAGG